MARMGSDTGIVDTERKGGKTMEDRVMYPLQSWPRPLQALHVWLQVTVHVFRESHPSAPPVYSRARLQPPW